MKNVKKKVIAGATALSLLAGIGTVGISANAANTPSKISIETAVKAALKKAQGTPSGVEMDKEHGVLLYEVEIQGKTKEYDVKVNAKTGRVIKVKTDRIEKELKNARPKVKIYKAASSAQKKAKGTLTSIELEKERGTLNYEAEIVGKTKEYEVKVNAKTGEVIKVKSETRDDD